MSWARLDDGFHDHPKVDGLSLAAVGLYTLCLTWAHRHRKTAVVPGHITEARVRKVAGNKGPALALELERATLWEAEPNLGGWVIHDFTDYLPKERDPDERAAAGRKGAASRWQDDGKPDGNLPSKSMGNGMASDGSRRRGRAPRPDPSRSSGSSRSNPPVPYRASSKGDVSDKGQEPVSLASSLAGLRLAREVS